MKICYVASTRIPTERVYGYAIMKLCEEWGSRGHTVELIVPDKKYGSQEDPFTYYGIKPTFTVRKLPASDHIGKRLTSSRMLFVLDFLSYVKALRTVRQSSETYIYTREYLLSFFLPRTRLFIELHTLSMRPFLFMRALRRTHGIIAISDGVKNGAIALGVPKEKICVAHDGVDLASFARTKRDRSLWEKLGIDAKKKIILYTGHLYEWKGAGTLAEAAPMLDANTHVVFIGGVDTELENFRKTYTAPNITVVPHQKRDAIPRYLMSADILVLPNSGKAEISRSHASPLKLFEYMAAQVPMVVSDVPSLREILTEKEAFFFKPDDAADLARAVSTALKNDAEACEKARRAYTDVQGYTWGARARRILGFLAH